MPKIYCSSCGNPIQYADIKPNFCTKCGSNLGSGKPVQNQVKIEPEIEIVQKPSISSLNWDIEIVKPKGEKLQNLAIGEKNNYQQRESDLSNLSKEEFLKEFQKEAGTLRRSNQAPDNDSANYDEDDDS